MVAEQATIRSVQIVDLASHIAMVVAVLSNGVIEKRTVEVATELTPEIVEPSCIVSDINGTLQTRIAECLKVDGAYVEDPPTGDYTMPDDETVVCHGLRGDPSSASPEPFDDLSLECEALGSKVEVSIARRPGYPSQIGTWVSVTCAMSPFPQTDCPEE